MAALQGKGAKLKSNSQNRPNLLEICENESDNTVRIDEDDDEYSPLAE